MTAPTKALVLLTTCSDYDGGEILGCRVVMVPLTFDADADQDAFYPTLRGHPLYDRWFTSRGAIHGRYVNKARKVWEDNLSLRFGDTAHVVDEWSVDR